MAPLDMKPALSPNWNERPAGTAGVISAIVLHCDADPNEHGTLDYMATPASKVSYHVLVGRPRALGAPPFLYRIVPDVKRAWAVGVSAMAGVPDVNDFSLSLAFANRNDGREPIAEAQIVAALAVCADWWQRFPALSIDRVTTHRIVALPAGRKTDPDPRVFDLETFRARLFGEVGGGRR